MYIEEQRAIWDKNWNNHTSIKTYNAINSRFSKETYYCFSKFINPLSDKLILEAGCGSGRLCCQLAQNFSNSKLIGLDISDNALKVANLFKKGLNIANVFFTKGDLFNLSYKDNHFDVVYNDGVIEHYAINYKPNYEDALREMVRVTKSGGKIIVAVPNWYNFPHTMYKWVLEKMKKEFVYGYEKSFKHSEIKKSFLRCDLVNIEISAFYPAHGFYRLSKKGFRKIFDLLGKLTDEIGYFDKVCNGYFTKKFGFEIVVKGVKT